MQTLLQKLLYLCLRVWLIFWLILSPTGCLQYNPNRTPSQAPQKEANEEDPTLTLEEWSDYMDYDEKVYFNSFQKVPQKLYEAYQLFYKKNSQHKEIADPKKEADVLDSIFSLSDLNKSLHVSPFKNPGLTDKVFFDLKTLDSKKFSRNDEVFMTFGAHEVSDIAQPADKNAPLIVTNHVLFLEMLQEAKSIHKLTEIELTKLSPEDPIAQEIREAYLVKVYNVVQKLYKLLWVEHDDRVTSYETAATITSPEQYTTRFHPSKINRKYNIKENPIESLQLKGHTELDPETLLSDEIALNLKSKTTSGFVQASKLFAAQSILGIVRNISQASGVGLKVNLPASCRKHYGVDAVIDLSDQTVYETTEARTAAKRIATLQFLAQRGIGFEDQEFNPVFSSVSSEEDTPLSPLEFRILPDQSEFERTQILKQYEDSTLKSREFIAPAISDRLDYHKVVVNRGSYLETSEERTKCSEDIRLIFDSILMTVKIPSDDNFSAPPIPAVEEKETEFVSEYFYKLKSQGKPIPYIDAAFWEEGSSPLSSALIQKLKKTPVKIDLPPLASSQDSVLWALNILEKAFSTYGETPEFKKKFKLSYELNCFQKNSIQGNTFSTPICGLGQTAEIAFQKAKKILSSFTIPNFEKYMNHPFKEAILGNKILALKKLPIYDQELAASYRFFSLFWKDLRDDSKIIYLNGATQINEWDFLKSQISQRNPWAWARLGYLHFEETFKKNPLSFLGVEPECQWVTRSESGSKAPDPLGFIRSTFKHAESFYKLNLPLTLNMAHADGFISPALKNTVLAQKISEIRVSKNVNLFEGSKQLKSKTAASILKELLKKPIINKSSAQTLGDTYLLSPLAGVLQSRLPDDAPTTHLLTEAIDALRTGNMDRVLQLDLERRTVENPEGNELEEDSTSLLETFIQEDTKYKAAIAQVIIENISRDQMQKALILMRDICDQKIDSFYEVKSLLTKTAGLHSAMEKNFDAEVPKVVLKMLQSMEESDWINLKHGGVMMTGFFSTLGISKACSMLTIASGGTLLPVVGMGCAVGVIASAILAGYGEYRLLEDAGQKLNFKDYNLEQQINHASLKRLADLGISTDAEAMKVAPSKWAYLTFIIELLSSISLSGPIAKSWHLGGLLAFRVEDAFLRVEIHYARALFGLDSLFRDQRRKMFTPIRSLIKNGKIELAPLEVNETREVIRKQFAKRISGVLTPTHKLYIQKASTSYIEVNQERTQNLIDFLERSLSNVAKLEKKLAKQTNTKEKMLLEDQIRIKNEVDRRILPELRRHLEKSATTGTNFDLVTYIDENADTLALAFKYNSFHAETLPAFFIEGTPDIFYDRLLPFSMRANGRLKQETDAYFLFNSSNAIPSLTALSKNLEESAHAYEALMKFKANEKAVLDEFGIILPEISVLRSKITNRNKLQVAQQVHNIGITELDDIFQTLVINHPDGALNFAFEFQKGVADGVFRNMAENPQEYLVLAQKVPELFQGTVEQQKRFLINALFSGRTAALTEDAQKLRIVFNALIKKTPPEYFLQLSGPTRDLLAKEARKLASEGNLTDLTTKQIENAFKIIDILTLHKYPESVYRY